MGSLYAAMPRAREALCSTLFISSPTFFSNPVRKPKIPLAHMPHRLHHQPRRYCAAIPASGLTGPVRSPELVALEYADLNLPDYELGVRIRQHVNPLKSSLLIPTQVPDWNEVFKDSTLPLMVDIGSGSGRFLLWLAKRNPTSKNYLGLEIRQKLVKRAEKWVDELAQSNIHFMFANAMVSFKQLVSTYPGPLVLVSILCPDPHFKKRYRKRRVMQKPLVDSIVDSLTPRGQVFIQSDVHEVALEMRNHFDAKSDMLVHVDDIHPNIHCDDDGWLSSNPMGIRTEREVHAELEGAKIYRRIYQKRS